MFKFSKLTWAIFVTFILSLVCIMFNCLWTPMIYPALILLCTGFILLAISLILNTNKRFKEQEFAREELLMELSVTEEGEQYILENSRKSKKYRRKLRLDKFNSYLPAVFCIVVACVILFLFVKLILKF